MVASLALAWLVAGCAGAYTYLHRYDVYRGFPTPTTPAGIARGTLLTHQLYSPSVGRRTGLDIYLPPHYRAEAAAGRRFPVLYLLHGWPGHAKVFIDAGAIAVDANVLIAQHKLPPMILVMPGGKESGDGDTEWADTPSGRWMSYVMDVVHAVDRHYATLADRQHRGLAGLSEGAYGAINIGLRHLRDFSVAESWSGYFTQTPTGPYAHATAAALRAASPAAYVPAIAKRIHRLGFRAWLYQGRQDTTNPLLIERFGNELHAAGGVVHYGFFPGGHDWALWRRQLPHMLMAAGRWFDQPPSRSRGFSHVGSHLSLAELARIKRKRAYHCLHRHIGPHTHVGLGCRQLRQAHGLPT